MGSARFYNAAVDFVDRHVGEGRGAKAAFVDPSRTLTYCQLRDAAARVGPMLAHFGVEPENRVAMIMLDTVDFPIVFWGAIRAGIVPIPLNTLLTADQYRYLLADSRAKVAFVSTALLPVVQEAAADVATLQRIIVAGEGPESVPRLNALLAAEGAPAAPTGTCTDEVAYWLYSSGTTGNPKGAMHVHSTPMGVARLSGQGLLGIREDDVIFSAPKMFFAYGLGSAVICPGWVGATTVLNPERPTPKSVFQTLHDHQPTHFYAVPTLYASILADPECTSARGSQRLRLCYSAGEPLPPHIGQGWEARFGLDIVNGVGASELGHLFLSNVPGQVEYGTSGIPIDGYDMRLVDEEGNDVPDGELGEMWVRGPTAAAGYWNQREKTRRTFLGEWTRTGDKYQRRPDGVYLYCGRSDDMFKVSGIWVSPFEVEAALISHPQVLEAAVVPAESPDGLIKPRAFVVLKEGAIEGAGRALYEELKAHVKREIGPWKYPRWIEFMDNLPKTASGKIQRYKLREVALQAAAEEAGASKEQAADGAADGTLPEKRVGA